MTTVSSQANPLAYLKAIVTIIGAILTGLAGLYGDEQWYTIALAVVTGIATYVVPNADVKAPGHDTSLRA